jgi:tetratricopeptide (TPR) repeat protein
MRRLLERLRRAASRLFLWPIVWSAALVQRLIGSPRERRSRAWAGRLRYAQFVQGLPALAGLVALVVCGGLYRQTGRGIMTSYANRAAAAFQAGDHETAIVCARRLANLDPENDAIRFLLAQAYEGAGDVDRAAELIRPLAPAGELGYPPAQLWLVRRALASEQATPAVVRDVEARLIRLRELPDVGPEAAVLSADLYLRTGRAVFVVKQPTLTAAAESVPELRLRLTQFRAAGGQSADELRPAARELAEVFDRRLKEAPDDAVARRNLAQARVLLGDFPGAAVTLREGLALDPADARLKSTLAAVSVALARQAVLAGRPRDERRRLGREALSLVEAYAPPGDATSIELAQLHRLLEQYDQAEVHYRRVAERSPAVRIELAEMLETNGRRDAAVAEYAAIRRDYESATAEMRNLPNYRRLAAVATSRSGDHAQAEAWLKLAAETDPQARAALVETYSAWAESLPDSATARRLELLRAALKLAPYYVPVVQQLLALAAADDASTAAEARGLLGDMIARGDAPAAAYLLLGTDALTRGDEPTALKYLEQARRLEPNFPAVLNNLAWTLAFGRKPDLPRALSLTNTALLKNPDDLRIRDTRGRILAKLGRPQEALADLEQCAEAQEGDATFHETIADVYRQLGLDEPAKRHRARAADLRQPGLPQP